MRKKHNKIKVLYIITKSNWGGAQRYVFDLAGSTAKSGYEVVVALGGKGLLKKKLDTTGIRTITIPNLERNINIFSEWKVFFDLLKIFKTERPHVIHLNSSKIGGLGTLAGRFTRIKRIIFTAHGWAHKEDRNIISKKVILFFSWLTVIFSHKTIVVSINDFKNSPKLFIHRKIIMIHNGISEIKFKDKTFARKEIKKYSRVPAVHGALWLGTISELHKNKGLYFAVRAINRLVKKGYNVVFFIIGEGEEKICLNRFIKDMGLEEKVFLLGHIDKASELLFAFDIFTLTSLKEGLPYTLLEAGLAGIPTVATGVGGIPEIVENMKSGILVCPKSPEDIEKVLSYLIDFKKERIQFGSNLKEKVKRDFTVEQMVAETVSLY